MLAASEMPEALAQGTEKGALGLGLILGEPTGLSAKLYLSDDTAVDAAVGGSLTSGWHVHADYLWHPWVLQDRDNFVMPAYVGAGGRLLGQTDGDFFMGARGVGGILFDFKDIPLDVFVEAALVGDWVFVEEDEDGFRLGINAGAGARYYF